VTPPDEAAHAAPTARAATRPKTARIRADQWTSLDELARHLHDARSVKVERITSNTLIRVAIDGLLEHGGRLHGDTEEQLLASWLEFLAERKAARGR
jgi:hypothetical protein